MYKEQVNASRIVKQLKQLLHDMDILRSQVLDNDIAAFDRLTTQSRTSTIQAIKEYLGKMIRLSIDNHEIMSTFPTSFSSHLELINSLKMILFECKHVGYKVKVISHYHFRVGVSIAPCKTVISKPTR